MKRLNPATGEPFKYGYVREDGKRFANYNCSRIKKDGYCAEVWVDDEGWAKMRARNSKQTKAYQRRRTAWLQEIKLERGCADCGYKEHPEALQFDHLPGHAKEFELGKLFTGREKAVEEMAKCEVVCANCHAIRTAERRSNDVGQVETV